MWVKIVNKTEFELPKYETSGSVGMDLRANLKPEKVENIEDIDPFKEEDWYEPDIVVLEPGQQQLIPTGLYIQLPKPVIEEHTGEGWGYEAQIRPRSGLAAKHGITIVNAPGTIDCFSEDSKIKTIKGEKSIKELKINDIVLSVNNNLNIEEDIITAIVDTGTQDIYEIETEDGKLEVTINTLIYTNNGIKKASELTEKDEIFFYK